MWGQIAAAAGSGLAGFLGGLSQRGTIKRAGTILQQAAEDEARRAQERAEEINPRFQEAYTQAQEGIQSTAFPGAENVEAAGREANVFLDPYARAGAQATTDLASLATGKAPTAADLEFDPGYQFRLTEGQKALERSAAARGALQGGGTLKALTRYAQGAASQEYGAAFDRFMRQQTERRATLSDLAGRGLTAGTQSGANLIGTTQFGANMRTGAADRIGRLGIESTGVQAGNLLTADQIAREQRQAAAQARANSMIGGSNALWGGISGALSGAGSALSLWDLSRSRAGGGGYRPTGPPPSQGEWGWGGYG